MLISELTRWGEVTNIILQALVFNDIYHLWAPVVFPNEKGCGTCHEVGWIINFSCTIVVILPFPLVLLSVHFLTLSSLLCGSELKLLNQELQKTLNLVTLEWAVTFLTNMFWELVLSQRFGVDSAFCPNRGTFLCLRHVKNFFE